jgi:large subunit ribosomal protein L9
MSRTRTRGSSGNAVAGTTKSSVDVLLAEKVDTLGDQGDIVRVKPGYARNFLLPQGLATVATDHNKKMVERHKLRVADLRAQQVKDLKKRADEISKYSVTLEGNSNEDGQLYGSIVAVDLSKALKEAGFDSKPEEIRLDGPLKELGMYTVKVVLGATVETQVKVWVVPAAAS